MVPYNTALDRGAGPPMERGDLGGRNPQFAAMPPNAKLLRPCYHTLSLTNIHVTLSTPSGIAHFGRFMSTFFFSEYQCKQIIGDFLATMPYLLTYLLTMQ